MLGRTSLKTTKIYSKVVDTKISKDMEALASNLQFARVNESLVGN